jgi:axial budding pattern protein 2
MASLGLLSAFLSLAEAIPTPSFPLNAQVPPIARVGQPFSFVFSQSTFVSTSPISYTLTNPPSWLSIDSATRRIYGIPREEDIADGKVVGVPIELVATDELGRESMAAMLVVARDPPPTIRKPLGQQMEGFGTYSPPSSLLSYPDKSFEFAFAPDTFSQSNLNYYAVTGDNAPLPAWMSFDPSRLAFAGTTPPFDSLIEPPQVFNFKLVASDITGFSAISAPFSIIVGTHEISVDDPVLDLNATVGERLLYTSLPSRVKMDGHPIQPGSVSATVSDLPEWVEFDESTWQISGNPNRDSRTAEFVVGFEDINQDRANVTVRIHVTTIGLLTESLSDMKVKSGGRLEFDLKQHLKDPSDVDVATLLEPSADWIHFDQTSLVLSGDVPTEKSASRIVVSFIVMSKSTGVSEGHAFAVNIEPSAATSSITASTSAGSPEPSSTQQAEPKEDINATKLSKSQVLLAVLFPLLLLVFAFAFILFCFYRRRRRRLSRRLERSTISGPLLDSFTKGDSDSTTMREASRQFDIGHTNALTSFQARKKIIVPMPTNMRASKTLPELHPSPVVPTPRRAFRSLRDHEMPVTRSWFAGRAGIRPGHKSRQSKSKTYLSDTSVHENDSMALGLLNYSKESKFYDGVAPKMQHLPLSSSIQHTPDLAYSGTPPQWPAKSLLTPTTTTRSSSSVEPSSPEAQLARPKTRLQNYSKRQSYHRRSTQPRASASILVTPEPIYNPRQRRKQPSIAIVDAITDETSTMTNGAMVHRPRPPYVASPTPATRSFNTSIRGQGEPIQPVSRRSEDSNFFIGARIGAASAQGSIRAVVEKPTPPAAPVLRARESWAGKRAAAAARRQSYGGRRGRAEQGRDSAGVASGRGREEKYSSVVSEADSDANWIVREVSDVSQDEWQDIEEEGEETAEESSGPETGGGASDADNQATTAAGVLGLGSANGVGKAVSRYSRLNSGEQGYYGEESALAANLVKAGSSGSARSDDFVVFV